MQSNDATLPSCGPFRLGQIWATPDGQMTHVTLVVEDEDVEFSRPELVPHLACKVWEQPDQREEGDSIYPDWYTHG